MALSEIGKYRVLGELGRGAMGAVYLAEDPFIGRRVAIKVMRPQVEEGSERFLREARTIGSLSHPNIVLLHDFGFLGELPYLVMEHVEGVLLERWLAQPHGLAERLRVLAGLCRAVAYAHQRGVLHRDLKPSNVLVRADGEAKLLDFGIARVQDTRMTATGIVLGTPEYLAPEVLSGEPFSPRTDLYSLGLVAYELLGGRNPFGADTVAACLRRVLEVEPVPLGPESGAPPEIASEIMACLAKDAAARPDGTDRLLAAVERGLAGESLPLPVQADLTRRLDTAAVQRTSRGRTRLVSATAVAIAVLGGGTWLASRGGRPQSVVPGLSSPSPSPATAAAPTPGIAGEPHGSATAPPLTVPTPAPHPRTPVPVAPSGERATSPRPTPEPLPAADRPAPVVNPAPSPTPVAAATVAAPPPLGAAAVASVPPVAIPPRATPVPGPRLDSLSPATLRRGEAATVRVHGDRLAVGWAVRIRRGGREIAGVRVLRVISTAPGEMVLSLLVEEDAPLGNYGLVLVSGSGESTNPLAFEVDL